MSDKEESDRKQPDVIEVFIVKRSTKIYSEEIVPKEYPPNYNVSEEWINERLYRLENSGNGFTPGDFHESHK